MNKRFAVFLTMLLIFPYIVNSATTFAIQETEKISLKPNAIDPDADNLTFTYTSPLNENGEWQTNYGDAGEYKSAISVSDGINTDSKDVIIIVKKKEESPKIDFYNPNQDTLAINEGQSVNFSVSASDLNKDQLSYEWLLDGKNAKDGQEFLYDTNYNDAGIHKVSVFVSDGNLSAVREWNVNVANVDVEGLLNEIKDATVNENEIARLKIPDFEKYGLAYTISEPIGNKNEWQTTYNDSGTYEIKIHAEGKGFSGDRIVKVAVNDVDRAPVFDKIENVFVSENEEIKIILSANDPDRDEITYSAGKLPEGASLEANAFTWKTSYDTVKKEGFVDNLMDKLKILSKSFYVQFTASSKDKKVVQNIIITVKDANRIPVLEEMEPITISEGEALTISPKAYDPDGDKVTLSYSGFIDKNTYKSKVGDAGTYNVKITASDGLLENSKSVQINIKHVNRAPVFGKMQDIKASEGDNIAVLLNANDPDGDQINYSIDNPPEGSSLKGNAFLWTPSYNLLNKKETKEYDLVFAASDGKSETRQIVKAEIKDKNRAPRIINATNFVFAKVNQPVIMYAKAADEDGDDLSYTWKFGLFESYKATPVHQRIFTTRGAKTVKVIVSDGIDSAEQTINVNVG